MSESVIELLRLSLTIMIDQLKNIILLPIHNYQHFKQEQQLLIEYSKPKLIESTDTLLLNSTNTIDDDSIFTITSSLSSIDNIYINIISIIFVFIMFSIVLYTILYNTKYEINNENLIEIVEIKDLGTVTPQFIPINQELSIDNINKISINNTLSSNSSDKNNLLLKRTFSNTSSLNSFKSNSTFLDSGSGSGSGTNSGNSKFNFDNSGFSPSERLINFSRSYSYKNNLMSHQHFNDDDQFKENGNLEIDEEEEDVTDLGIELNKQSDSQNDNNQEFESLNDNSNEKYLNQEEEEEDSKNDFAQDDFKINDNTKNFKPFPLEKYQEY
ncbi:uncharacterized protein KGF55_001611 [Candida pseudojiufengensis]|uniref:uncharacterized protein n=1 Tax=Candida pseudojiufengensis TaxID=497109 RepID=UPI0022249A34|nr:uncharacterized protein KGF55_001611 [Candida pseudojiufengensis]KAI5965390.1 hypothetical protein KGF55_001611 [Candida pseudojiufengensis]